MPNFINASLYTFMYAVSPYHRYTQSNIAIRTPESLLSVRLIIVSFVHLGGSGYYFINISLEMKKDDLQSGARNTWEFVNIIQ